MKNIDLYEIMNAQELQNQIDELRTNVASLIDALSDSRKNELQLRQQMNELKTENENYREQVKFLEEKGKMANLASVMKPGDQGEMKQKIRELVRDIDDCIAMIKS